MHRCMGAVVQRVGTSDACGAFGCIECIMCTGFFRCIGPYIIYTSYYYTYIYIYILHLLPRCIGARRLGEQMHGRFGA